jgi:signal transduction histidine kinase
MSSMDRYWRSATVRLALTVSLIFALGSAALLVAIEIAVVRFAEQSVRDALRDQMAVMRADLEHEGVDALVQMMAHERSGEAGSHLYYRIVTHDGAAFGGGLPERVTATSGYGEMKLALKPDGTPASDQTVRVVTLTERTRDGSILSVGRDTFALAELQSWTRRLQIWGTGGLVAMALICGLTISMLFIRRLDSVNAAAARIMQGDLTERLPAIGFGREFDDLSANLNLMLDRLEGAMGALREVSVNVAHDLRTPLTRLKNTLESVSRAPPAGRDAMIEAAITETDEILIIFAALMRISQIEGGQGRGAFKELDLSEVVGRVLEAYTPEAEASGRRLLAVTSAEAFIRGDAAMLSQALANLIENGLTHTPPGATIRVVVATAPSQVRLSVADDGDGVPDADLGQLGERFFRSDRSRSAPGSGLGLAMVLAVAEIHQATCEIKNLNPGLILELAFRSSRD